MEPDYYDLLGALLLPTQFGCGQPKGKVAWCAATFRSVDIRLRQAGGRAGKLSAESPRANRLLAWGCALFQRASRMLADTPAHADYFAQVLGVPRKNLAVVYVGGEEALFKPEPLASDVESGSLKVLFYGSFILLQAPPGRYRGRKAVSGATGEMGSPGAGTVAQDVRGECQGAGQRYF